MLRNSPVWKLSDRRRTGDYLKADILAAIELAESQQRNDGEDGHNGGQCGCSAVVAADDLGIDCYRQGLGLAGMPVGCQWRWRAPSL